MQEHISDIAVGAKRHTQNVGCCRFRWWLYKCNFTSCFFHVFKFTAFTECICYIIFKHLHVYNLNYFVCIFLTIFYFLSVVHAVRSEVAIPNDTVHPLSSTEVEELITKAGDASLSEISLTSDEKTQIKKASPRKEIPGVQSRPPHTSPGPEQPVTMIFMGYQNVEDENETKKVLGVEEAITAELVIIGDGDAQPAVDGDLQEKVQHPPNGAPADTPNKSEKPETNDTAAPTSGEQDLSMKKQRCKCCSVM